MDFFSKLGEKASKTYQITKEKAVNLSEELKIKGKINDLKEKIEEVYKDIGKIVYNEVKDGKDVSKEEITIKCESISKYQDEIEKLQSDISALKNVVKEDAVENAEVVETTETTEEVSNNENKNEENNNTNNN